MKMLKYALAAAAAAFITLVGVGTAEARQVCLFAQTEMTVADAQFINICFRHDQVVKVKTIYSGANGNMVEVILREGKWFYKNGLTKAQMQACIAGRGPCDKYQNIQLRDLTRGDTSIFKKGKPLHRNPVRRTDRDVMACAGGSTLHCN